MGLFGGAILGCGALAASEAPGGSTAAASPATGTAMGVASVPLPASPPGPSAGAYRELAAGQLSELTDERIEVVQTRSAWEGLWRLHDPTGSPPRVDFATEQALFVVRQRATGGFTLVLGAVTTGPDAVTVEVVEQAPGPGDITTQALTQPWVALALPRSALPVRVLTAVRRGLEAPRPLP